jgi:cell division protein FtsN
LQQQDTDFDFSKIVIPSSSSPTNNVNVRPQKKSNAGYWILAIILIIVATLLILYLFSKEFKQSVNSLIGINQTTKTTVIDTVKTVTQDTIKAKPVTNTEQQIQSSNAVEGGKYQVILGSYLERSVAEDFANELRSKGYSAKIPDRLAGEWILVIAYETNDKADAERMQNKFMSEGYDDAYVRTRPGAAETTTTTTKPTTVTQSQPTKPTSNANLNTTLPSIRGKYQVIAGCFLERSNAEKRGRELSDKGFDVTVPDRLYGEWVIVIVYEGNDVNEANKIINQCVAAGYDDAWIRKR